MSQETNKQAHTQKHKRYTDTISYTDTVSEQRPPYSTEYVLTQRIRTGHVILTASEGCVHAIYAALQKWEISVHF